MDRGVSLLGGWFPDLPPVPRATPAGELMELEPQAPPGHGTKDFTGWRPEGSFLVGLRRGKRSSDRSFLWVFLCLLCGNECERPPHRLAAKPAVRSCGCGPRGGSPGKWKYGSPLPREQYAQRLEEIRRRRAQEAERAA